MGLLTRYLADDHARLDALLSRARSGPAFDAGAFEAFRAGLLRHIGIEEKLLLPEARRRRGGEPLPQAARLRRDHAALGALLVPTPDHALAGEIATLLAEHNLVEEGDAGVYAACEALLGDDVAALLARAEAAAPPPTARHFDGAGTVRTVAAALALADRRKK
ncbi:MAG TPA: hemerythrin domain-containing protein [Polyangia bacterium]|nr:hemerythrin domain-containing protein [Polyangia bacterium]